MAVLKVKCENQILLENSQSKPIVCLFFFKIVASKNPLFRNENKKLWGCKAPSTLACFGICLL